MAKQVRFLRDYDVRADAAIAAGAAELMADKTPSRRSKKDAG
jgi:hypothetical protein